MYRDLGKKKIAVDEGRPCTMEDSLINYHLYSDYMLAAFNSTTPLAEDNTTG